MLAALALVLGGGATGAAVTLALDDDPAPTARTSLQATPSAQEGSGDEQPDEPLSQVADAVLPSVVSIVVEGRAGTQGGSGVVISEDGMVLTNNHVVSTAASGGDLTVTFSDGEHARAEVVGLDPASDLAVIQAEGVGDRSPATLGSSADLHVGDTVLAIGSPLGLDGSVTSGIVSAVNRAINLGAEQAPFGGGGGGPSAVINAIQTDAAINPGNSGGALINTEGEVVGIPTAIASPFGGASTQAGNIGLGFAIPIDEARSVAEQLVEDGSATHAYLGVQIGDAENGALVGRVEEGSPASEAGLRNGDIITAVDGDPVPDATALTAIIRGHAPGDEVEISYTRDGEEANAQVTLGSLQD